jgi:hypothetical protein
VREKVGEQQAMSAHDGAPRPPDAVARGEVAGPEAAEDVGEHVVRQDFRQIHGFRATLTADKRLRE